MSELSPTEVVVRGRLSYADLFKPRTFKGDSGGQARYKTNVLVPKDTPEGAAIVAKLKAAMTAAAKEKWGDKIPPITGDKKCVKDGDREGAREEEKGHWVVSASETANPPTLLRRDKSEAKESDGELYSGAVADVLINVWAQDNSYGKRLNANLRAVRFVAHGEKFGKGGTTSREAFADLADDEGESAAAGYSMDDEIPF